MKRDHFTRREDVPDLMPLMEYMRSGLWSAQVILREMEHTTPLFQIENSELAAMLRLNAVKHLLIRNAHSGVFLLTNGLVADIVYKRVRYFSPLYGVFAELWLTRWNLPPMIPMRPELRKHLEAAVK